MRVPFYMLLVALMAIIGVHAAAPQKAILMSYPNDTPASVIEEAKQAIKDAGGMITHEYNIIKGFAANAPAKVLESVQALGAKYNAVMEEDQTITVAGHTPKPGSS